MLFLLFSLNYLVGLNHFGILLLGDPSCLCGTWKDELGPLSTFIGCSTSDVFPSRCEILPDSLRCAGVGELTACTPGSIPLTEISTN
jgi:hypothetical protein